MSLIRRFRSPALAAFVATQLATSGGQAAGASDKRACAVSYELGQQLRNQQKLRKAREQLVICAQNTCPQVIAPDCAMWLKEVEAATPTITFRVRDERGRSVSDFRVTVDGDALSRDAESAASPFDPGAHIVRIEADGFVSFEQKVTLLAGEKGSVVDATLSPVVREAPPADPPRREPMRELPKAEPRVAEKATEIRLPEGLRTDASTSKVGPAVYVVGGVSFLALSSFTFLGLQGTREADELRSSCAPGCLKADVDAARTKLVAANVSLGIGIGAAAIAGILFFAQSSSTPQSSNRPRLIGIDIHPASQGGGGQLLTTFSAP